MSLRWLILLLPVLACRAEPERDTGDTGTLPIDTGGIGVDSGDTGPVDTGAEDTGPVDADADGSPAYEDCDDSDSTVYPGAPEEWDGLDNDCDGQVDAEGSYLGTHQVRASVTYEGTPYAWNLDCPVDLERVSGSLDFQVVCTPVSSDADEQALMDLLLGESFSISPYPGDEEVEGASWSGWTEVVSSNGWDTEGEGSLEWSDISKV
ncbi:MAG: putative metal-binding motif-containing protein, partial [Myxococcota bacterium]|nr:putative metal-binding motif-containing protein [Myxococcota bacterium]